MPLGTVAQETDPETGLVKAEGWQEVKTNCTVCHSASLITQNHGSRTHWQSLIRWMQATQGLWEFRPEVEATILDYLAEHYGPKEGARRSPLPPDMLPLPTGRGTPAIDRGAGLGDSAAGESCAIPVENLS